MEGRLSHQHIHTDTTWAAKKQSDSNSEVKFQVNRSLGRHRNTGQHRLYEFCYLLPFDLWISYLAKIFFSKRNWQLILGISKFYKDL
jgi:hypothetical protein